MTLETALARIEELEKKKKELLDAIANIKSPQIVILEKNNGMTINRDIINIQKDDGLLVILI